MKVKSKYLLSKWIIMKIIVEVKKLALGLPLEEKLKMLFKIICKEMLSDYIFYI